ncbi:hypothetical protein HMF8227_00536 [Saliniradius amylolyticus]|uniref:TIGR03545 family protein n=1 Tax=Saliniradius amylolyticus TaxID=2183582 RepID=A0A2S2E0G4_9ALTE|nr:TIGR03545 family protein [Saliniradius amylolyticus]AWL11032.1 hypothetical protein HMF8227_00536 [Saliniradius amylolyticus]
MAWLKKGLWIVLGLIVAVLAAVFLFLDTWIKLAVEEAGAQATGAEVNVAEVSHTFSPFSVTLSGLQMTDAARPEYNKVTADTIKAEVQLKPLLMNKVIVDQVQILGVKFDQKRAEPGDVYRQPDGSPSPFDNLFNQPVNMPSVDEVLNNNTLKTTQAIEQAQSAYQQHQDQLQQQYQALPDKQALADYKQQLQELQDTDYSNPAELVTAKEKFDRLKEQLKQEQQKVSQFLSSVRQARDDLGPKLASLKDAPQQDYQQLKGVLAGDAAAIGDLTEALFGPQMRQWSDQLLAAYDLVAPMLQSKGESAQTAPSEPLMVFEEFEHLPDILIKQADVSVQWQDYAIDSRWLNITDNHQKLGQATEFMVDAPDSPLWSVLKLDGQFQFLAEGLFAQQSWDLAGLKLGATRLLESDNLTSLLESGLLSATGKLSVNKDQMDGDGVVNLAQLAIQASGENKLTRTIASALSSLSALNIDTGISGHWRSPKLNLSSSLDNQLKDALMASLGEEAQGKLTELQQRLQAKAAGPLDKLTGGQSQWQGWQDLAQGQGDSIETMLEAKLKGALDKEKDKLTDKLKNKLFGGAH